MIEIIAYTFLAFAGCIGLWAFGIELYPMLHYVKHKECQLDTVCRHGLQL